MRTEELKHLLEAASPGLPWTTNGSMVCTDDEAISECAVWPCPTVGDERNAQLIAAAVNALPALLRVAEAAREVLESEDRTLPLARLRAALAEVEA